jgi:hypothetical protein
MSATDSAITNPNDGNTDDKAEAYRAIFTGAILATYVAVIIFAMVVSSKAPTLDAQGKTLVDPFANVKDLLTGIGAVATLVLGYWFGAAGKAQAETVAAQTQGALTAAIAATPDGQTLDMPGLQKKFPKAFGLKG